MKQSVEEKFEIGNYIATLITEKGRDPDASLGRDGHVNLSYRNLIEFVRHEAAEKDQKAIHNMLVEIDFNNGNVFHYLDFLVDGMIKAKGLNDF